MTWYMWLVVIAVLLIIEVFTMGLTTIWFCIGSIGGIIMSLLGFSTIWQIVVFAVVSIIAMLLFRPISIKYLNKVKATTNIDDLVGKVVVLTQDIDESNNLGKADLKGMEWTVFCDEKPAPKMGDKAIVRSIEGVKLVVGRNR